jgi:hypothetical protein
MRHLIFLKGVSETILYLDAGLLLKTVGDCIIIIHLSWILALTFFIYLQSTITAKSNELDGAKQTGHLN